MVADAVFIEPLHASLISWGSILHSSEGPSSTSTVGGAANFHALKTEPISFDAHFRSSGAEDFTTLLINAAFVMVCLGFLFVCLLSNGDDDGDGPGDGVPSPQKLESLRDVQCREGEGSWAQAYRDAKGEERDALELLFRCHIISTYEFAESKVSQEHIDECVWIGCHMLRQKPLSDWAAMRYQAKEIFEQNAAACFQARSDSRSSRQRSRTPTPEQTPMNTRQNLSTSSSLSLDSHLKSTPRLSIQVSRLDCHPSTAEPHHKGFRPAMQLPRLESQPKVTPRPAVQIPRMDLRSLSSGKEQSSVADDDDPYTTRDIF